MRNKAFSLVEVVVAVGIFAISIVGVIGLLAPTSKSINDVRDADDATRVVGAIQEQLQTLALTSAGWAQLTSSTAAVRLLRLATEVTSDDSSSTFNPGSNNYTLFASRDGSRLGIFSASNTWQGTKPDGTNSTNFDGFKYFEITLIRNGDATTGLSPVTNDLTAGFLAYTIRLRWPAYLPNGQRLTDNAQKNVLLVPGAVHR